MCSIIKRICKLLCRLFISSFLVTMYMRTFCTTRDVEGQSRECMLLIPLLIYLLTFDTVSLQRHYRPTLFMQIQPSTYVDQCVLGINT